MVSAHRAQKSAFSFSFAHTRSMARFPSMSSINAWSHSAAQKYRALEASGYYDQTPQIDMRRTA